MKKLLPLLTILFLLSACTWNSTQKINIKTPEYTTVMGKFYHEMPLTDTSGTENTYFQFRSDNNAVWWVLTAEEVGETPNFTDKYRLTFYDNGTTEAFTTCDCTPDMDCECFVYDDIFIGISKVE